MGVGEGLAANQSGSPPAILPRSPDSRVKAGIYRNPARSRPRFKLQPVGFLRSRQFSPDSIREKRLPKQGKIAEDYSIGDDSLIKRSTTVKDHIIAQRSA